MKQNGMTTRLKFLLCTPWRRMEE